MPFQTTKTKSTSMAFVAFCPSCRWTWRRSSEWPWRPADAIVSYVQGGCGDERTQNLNMTAFERWGLVPLMMVDGSVRDMSITLFGLKLPTPILMAPIGVLGICSQDGHGDRRPGCCSHDGRAHDCIDVVSRSARKAVRQVRCNARLLSALHPHGSRCCRKPCASGRNGRDSKRSLSRSTLGSPAGGHEI